MAKRSLVDRAYEAIRIKLDTGELRGGDQIVEDAIAEEIGVSRTPVRSAMQILVAQGPLQKHNNHGCFVAKFGVFEVYEIFEAREALEGLAARLMATRENEQEVAMLWETHRELLAAESEEDFLRHRMLDVQFHRQIISGCGKLYIGKLVNGEALVTMTFMSYFPADVVPPLSWENGSPHPHVDIVAAIEAHDATAAEAAACRHIRSSKETMIRRFEGPEAAARAQTEAQVPDR